MERLTMVDFGRIPYPRVLPVHHRVIKHEIPQWREGDLPAHLLKSSVMSSSPRV